MARPKREVPWLDQRGGVWYACWYDAAERRTRRVSLRTGDAAQAQARFAAFLTEGAALHAQRPARMTVSQALADYQAERVPQLVAGQRRVQQITNLREYFGEAKAMADVTAADCRAYAAWRQKDGMAASTVYGELALLTAAANLAVKYKRMPPDQTPMVELPEVPESEARWLTKAEFAALRAAAARLADEKPDRTMPDVRDFIDLAYYTASRRTAILLLEKFQISFTKDAAGQIVGGKINLDKPQWKKTRKKRPVVPIDPAILPTVVRLVTTAPGTRLLQCGPRIDKAFALVVEEAGLEDVTPHALRHSRATHLLQDGVTPWAVAGLLGDRLETVMRTYGHHCPDHLAEVLGGAKPGALSGA